MIKRIENQQMTGPYCVTHIIEVYRTTVASRPAAELLLRQLRSLFPDWSISFDLEDCDKILRVEGNQVCPGMVMHLVRQRGIACVVLE